MKHALVFVVVASWIIAGPPAAQAKPLQVVATLPVFADLAKTIGGDRVNVNAVAGAQFNPHFIEPKPSDVLRVKRADLLVHGGLDLEAWRGPLLDAAGNTRVFPGQPGELDLSQGIALLEVPTRGVSRSEGDIHLYGNPHYWVDPENGKIMAQAIAAKLAEVDPAHAAEYQARLKEFVAKLDAKIADWHHALAPYQGQEVVGYHNEWPYLMRFAGLRMEQFLEPKPGIPPTPKQVETIKEYVAAHHVRGIVLSTYFPRQAADAVAQPTGARVVFLCQNVGEVKEAADYIAMVDYNVTQLVHALAGGGPGA